VLTSPKLLFVAPTAGFFLSHRLSLAIGASEAGFDVVVACPMDADVESIRNHRLAYREVPMARGVGGWRDEAATLLRLRRLFKQERPAVVHLITAKAALHGGLAARWLGIPTVAAVTGLGHIFVHETWKARVLRRILLAGYGLGLNNGRNHFIFQNEHDQELFRANGLLGRAGCTLIPGSGADLQLLSPKPLPPGVPVIVMPCRMLRDKGVLEFVRAAEILHAKGVKARFILVGDPDPGNPTSLTAEELKAIHARGFAEWRPFTKEIGRVLADAHVVALPSFYREGVPKTLIDAAAAGRAVVTTDTPGCRDAVLPGKTGLLCPPRDAQALADRLEQLIADPETLRAMGLAARQFAEHRFDVRQVTAEHVRIYRTIARTRPPA
jgi:glycosyltransferase involved in cell wall biosynthesis